MRRVTVKFRPRHGVARREGDVSSVCSVAAYLFIQKHFLNWSRGNDGMAKKYDIITRPDDAGWTAEVVRRKTSRGTTIERSQSGFASRDEALAWGQVNLDSYLATRAVRTKARKRQRSAARERQRLFDDALATVPFRNIIALVDADVPTAAQLRDYLRYMYDLCWQELALRGLKDGESESVAMREADKIIRHWSRFKQLARDGEIDRMFGNGRDAIVSGEKIQILSGNLPTIHIDALR
jgi:hypothetical protein